MKYQGQAKISRQATSEVALLRALLLLPYDFSQKLSPFSSGRARLSPNRRRVVQANEFNESRIQTVVCAAITPNLKLAAAPGNVQLTGRSTGLKRKSVANVSQLVTIDRRHLSDCVGKLPPSVMCEVSEVVRLVLGL